MSFPSPPSPLRPDRIVSLLGHTGHALNIVNFPDGRRLATASQDKRVFIFDCSTGVRLRTLSGHTAEVEALAPLGREFLASGDRSANGVLRLWNISTGACLSRTSMGGEVCAIVWLGKRRLVLSAGKDLVFATIGEDWRIVVARRVTRAHGKLIRDIAEELGSVISVANDGSSRVWDARSGVQVAELRRHRHEVTRVAVRDGLVATCSKDGSINVYRLDSLKLIWSRDGIHGMKWAYGVDFSGGDGAYVLSAGNDKNLCLSEVATGRMISRMELGFFPRRLKFLGDRRIAVVGLRGEARIFTLSRDTPGFRAAAGKVALSPNACEISRSSVSRQPNPIVRAFNTAIATCGRDDSFSVAGLLAVLQRRNIDGVSALFWAHNLILLAIRCDILTRESIQKASGRPFYLMEEVYFPISKLELTHFEKLLTQRVLAHAEEVGIIKNGFDIVAAWDLREEARKDSRRVSAMISTMVVRICEIEGDVDGLKRWSDGAGKKINEIIGLTDARRKEVLELSRSFNELHCRLRENESRRKIISLTRAALSMIPVVGSALGNASSAAAEIFLGLNTEDVVQVGVATAKGTVSFLGGVDVSNFTAARRLLSEETLTELGPVAKRVVYAAAEDSYFRSFNELENALKALQNPRKMPNTSLGPEAANQFPLDITESMMDAPRKKCEKGSGSSSAPQQDHPDIWERLTCRFRFLCREEGRKDILLEQAAEELLPLLFQAGHRDHGQVIDKDVLHDVIEYACGNSGRGRVNEAAFTRAFELLAAKFDLPCVRGESDQTFIERFSYTAGSQSRILIRTARSALVQLFTDRLAANDRHSKSDSSLNFRCVAKELSKRDAEEILRKSCNARHVDMVGVDEFVDACRCVFYGEFFFDYPSTLSAQSY